jgi:hypothetical protein
VRDADKTVRGSKIANVGGVDALKDSDAASAGGASAHMIESKDTNEDTAALKSLNDGITPINKAGTQTVVSTISYELVICILVLSTVCTYACRIQWLQQTVSASVYSC